MTVGGIPFQSQVLDLLDKQALQDNLLRYCRGIDRMDVELAKSTYWPDSTEDHGRFQGSGLGWCEEAMRSRERLVSNNHHISNILAEIDGHQARREAMFLNVSVFLEGPTVLLGGRYRDVCEKRDGEWRVLARVCVWDWSHKLNPDPAWEELTVPDSTNWGRFYPLDPIYQDWTSTSHTSATDSNRSGASA